MWNKKRSLLLSKIATLLFMAGLLAAFATAPWLVRWFVNTSVNTSPKAFPFFIATLYSGGLLAAFVLAFLYAVLRNIGKGQVFTAQNISLLRRISWLCIGGAVISAASAVYYIPWAFIRLAAAFIGLIVRVVKNVLAEALALKEENDYNI